jgi:pimeloyl-ACP methyl ester carboxylesterase
VDPLLQQWREGGRTFSHGGRSLFYRDQGSGPVLLCLHGYPTASWDWHRLWPLLVGRYRLVAMDMLGFGFSDKPRGHDYSIGEQTSLHEALLASLGVEHVHVLAHDYGDTVAQELMARQAQRRSSAQPGLQLGSVTLLNGGLFPEAHHARTIQSLLRSPLGPLLVRLLDERAFARSFTPIFGAGTQPDNAELARFWALIEHNRGRLLMGRLLHYIAERKRHRERWVGALTDATMPLQLVVGMEDPVSGPDMARRWRELVPRGRLVELEGIGHYPQWECPSRVAASVMEIAR